MSLLSLLAICLVWFACGRCALAAASPEPNPPPRIWSGVVLATNNPHPTQAPELRKYAGKLHNIFGYNQFELVGQYSDKIDDPNERWLAPSKDFSFSVKSHAEPGPHSPARIALFQGRRMIAVFETHLSPDSPLFIRGPLYAKGQVVFVLHVEDEGEGASARVVRTVTEAGYPPGYPLPVRAAFASPPREKVRVLGPEGALRAPGAPPFLAPRREYYPVPERYMPTFGPGFGPAYGPTYVPAFGPGFGPVFRPPLGDRFGPIQGRGGLDPKLGRQ